MTNDQLLFQSLESSIKAEFDAAMERAMAKEVSEEVLAAGIHGIKWMLYNKSNAYVTCMVDVINNTPSVESSDVIELSAPCVDARVDEMRTFTSLAEYGAALDPAMVAVCQMKTRLFERERQLPPYSFLAEGADMGLFDFGALNQCLRDRSALGGNMTA